MAAQTATLAFEIGTEELPAFDLHAATEALEGLVNRALSDARIPFASIGIHTTPRRLIMIVEGVPEQTEESLEEFRGPSAQIAFDESGAPTKAAIGFARGKGLTAEDLERRDVDGVEYVFAMKRNPSMRVAELLPEALGAIIEGISWPKAQRWGSRTEQFSRPVRWLYAVLGDEVVPVSFAGLDAGNLTYGHRFLAPGPFTVPNADELLPTLRAAQVVPSEAEREASIREQVRMAEEKTGLAAELPAKTLAEVINLTEYPTVMVGTFDESFLAVPKEITVDAMLVHQRYFPLFNADGTLANKFLITSNGDPTFEANIIDGNQRVVAARLYDAKFFYDEDLKKPLEAYVDDLENVVFQESLGTMRAKTDRVVALAESLAADAELDDAARTDAARAALLAKADLVSGAVVEFTSVQGIMGSYYAEAAGENERVARAIADHYRPRFSGDELPTDEVGQIVAVADKLDTICGLFAVDQAPTGSSDPFALRRSAIGIVSMLEAGLPISLVAAIDEALSVYERQGLAFDRAKTREAVIDFFITRTKVMLRDAGVAADTVDAVLAAGVEEPAEIIARARALEAARRDAADTFDDLATAFARANNLREAEAGTDYDEGLMGETERALAAAIVKAAEAVHAALADDDYAGAVADLAALRTPIDAFFEDVMVKDEDAALRANRMKLLNTFVEVFANVADFGAMAKK